MTGRLTALRRMPPCHRRAGMGGGGLERRDSQVVAIARRIRAVTRAARAATITCAAIEMSSSVMMCLSVPGRRMYHGSNARRVAAKRPSFTESRLVQAGLTDVRARRPARAATHTPIPAAAATGHSKTPVVAAKPNPV